MDTEQSDIVQGSDPPQQEPVIEKEAVSKTDVETPATADKDGEHVNGHTEVENGVDTEQAETREDPKTEENAPKDEPEPEPAAAPSEKVDLVENASAEPDQDKPEETPVKESVPEPAAAQEPVETQPPKEEDKKDEKEVENVEAQSENEATGVSEKAAEPEKKEEGKIVEAASAVGDKEEEEKKEEEKPTDKAEEKSEANAAEAKPEVKEQEEDPTPAAGSLAFAILEHEKTKDLLKATRTLVVLRGLPGSGKSFLAHAITDVYSDHATVLSADDHGVKPESGSGYKAFDDAIVEKCSASPASPLLVVVDDTNHTQDRLARLRDVAVEHQLIVFYLEPRTEWSRDTAQLAKKTKRGLEPAKVEAMKKTHEEMSIPLFFGFFMFPTVQDQVREMSLNFLKKLVTLESFKKHLSDFGGKEGEEVDLEQYFKAKGTLHCTTKFTNYGKAEGAKEYTENKVVQDLYGSVSDLSLSALFVTPRTVGARVALTDEQLQLWPDDAEKEAASVTPAAADLPRGSRAHVTLGCAEGVQPVQTGYDLLQLLALRKDGQQGETEELEAGALTYYGEGRWYLDLKEPISAAAAFSSSYKAKAAAPVKKEKKKQKCTIL